MPFTEVMPKFKRGELHSGGKGGPKVTNPKQAVAIMLSEKRKGTKDSAYDALHVAFNQPRSNVRARQRAFAHDVTPGKIASAVKSIKHPNGMTVTYHDPAPKPAPMGGIGGAMNGAPKRADPLEQRHLAQTGATGGGMMAQKPVIKDGWAPGPKKASASIRNSIVSGLQRRGPGGGAPRPPMPKPSTGSVMKPAKDSADCYDMLVRDGGFFSRASMTGGNKAGKL